LKLLNIHKILQEVDDFMIWHYDKLATNKHSCKRWAKRIDMRSREV